MLRIVYVKWGDPHGVDAINRSVRSTPYTATCAVRFTRITDDFTRRHAPKVSHKPFPISPAPFESLRSDSRTLRVEDLFMSCVTHDSPRIFPASLFAKHAGECMSPTRGCEAVKKHLPSVRARRSNQVAITFPEAAPKPARLTSFAPRRREAFQTLPRPSASNRISRGQAVRGRCDPVTGQLGSIRK